MTENDEQLIHKFLNKSLTEEDWDILLVWLEKPTNKKVFNSYVRADYYLHLSREKAGVDSQYSEVLKSMQGNVSKGMRKLWKGQKWIAAATVALMFGIGLGWYYYSSVKENQPIEVVETSIEQGTDGAILTLEDGSEVVLQKGSSYSNQYVTSNGEEVLYGKGNVQGKYLYNTLKVARGKQFSLTLIDGTKVWLNSDSQIRYPIQFEPGETRIVELLYGEAYFDVSPSTEHDGDAFEVNHEHQTVRVLGTEFNIKAYTEEAHLYTTLVEGKVQVGFEDQQSLLRPNDQAIVDIMEGTIEIQEVDVQEETAWRNGLFMFRSRTLGEIAITLSRWYDINIEIQNKAMEEVEFKGTLSKNQPLEEILELIRNTKFINSYDIEGNKVIIK